MTPDRVRSILIASGLSVAEQGAPGEQLPPEQREALAQRLGAGRPLSQIVIEERRGVQPLAVGERLPEGANISYVLAWEDGAGWVAAAYHPDYGWAHDARWGGEGDEVCPSHWLPYPPRPEGEERC